MDSELIALAVTLLVIGVGTPIVVSVFCRTERRKTPDASDRFDPSKPVPPPTFLKVLWDFLKRSPPHHLFYLLLLYFFPTILLMALHVTTFHPEPLPAEPAIALEPDYYKKPGCYWVKIEEAPRDVFGHPGDTVAYVMEGVDRKVARFNSSSYGSESTNAHAWIHSQDLRDCDPPHTRQTKE